MSSGRHQSVTPVERTRPDRRHVFNWVIQLLTVLAALSHEFLRLLA